MITTIHFPKLLNSLKCNKAFSNFLMNSYLQHRSHYRSNVGHSQTHQTITQGCGADEKQAHSGYTSNFKYLEPQVKSKAWTVWHLYSGKDTHTYLCELLDQTSDCCRLSLFSAMIFIV